MDTQFTNNPIFSTIRMLLSKGTTIQLGQRQKSNSFSILGVAYITRHSLVKSIEEGRKKRQMGALYCLFLWYGSENPLYGPLFGAVRGIRDSRTGGGGGLHMAHNTTN